MKIVVLDIDQAHNQRLKSAVSDDEKTDILFCEKLDELVDLLNGNRATEKKKAAMEKTLVDGAGMLSRTVDGIAAAKVAIEERRTLAEQMTGPEQAANKTLLLSEMAALQEKIEKSESLKRKLEVAIASRKLEIEALSATLLNDEQKKIHIVMVDRSYLGNLSGDWVEKFRALIADKENQNVPIVAMGYNEDLEYIKRTVQGGISDYFVKPMDTLLLKNRINRLSGRRSESGGKVFELTTKAEIKILKTATVIKMSEFDFVVETPNSFEVNEIVELYAEPIGGDKGSRLLACCTEFAPDPKSRATFITSFSFVGHTLQSMTGMRKWLRAQYLAQKQKEE